MLDALVVQPGSAAGLEQRDPRDTLGLPGKEEAKEQLAALLEELSSLQVRLYAEGTAERPARPAGSRRLRQGRDDPPRLHRASTRRAAA